MRIGWLLAASALFLACSSETSSKSPPQGDEETPTTEDGDTKTENTETAATSTPVTDAGSAVDGSSPAPLGLSSGCMSKTGKTGVQNRTMKVAGKDRAYTRVIPDGYTPGKAVALVLAFHGLGGTGPKARAGFDLEAQTKDGAILIYPTALPDPDNVTRWILDAGSDDQKFVEMLVDEAGSDYCIDRGRTFATGFSNGAAMSTWLGCRRGDLFRAIAPVAPGNAVKQLKGCVGEVALWEAWGTQDAEHEAGTKAARDYFIAANGCSNTTAKTALSQCVAYQGCKDGLPVTWCEHPGAHEWPAFAAQGVWRFFNALK